LTTRVVLWPTCLVALLRPRAAGAARRVLERSGLEVELRPGAVCCGQPAWNSGHVDHARKVASGAVDALAGDETIVLCSGSCTTMVAVYWSEMFEGTSRHEAARAVSSRARELSSFLAEDVGLEALGPMGLESPHAIGYHDSCHMLRALNVSEAPRRLLSAVDGLELKDLAAPERCCGFGGTFSLRYPELSTAMADEKVDDLEARSLDEVVSSDIGCLAQICGRAEARGIRLTGRHIAEVLDEAARDTT
jgi:L-lactate dehydrogenase complex protein LldE